MPKAGDYVRLSDVTGYYCSATQSTVQTVNNAAFTAITFDGADAVDSLSIHDPVTNNSRFVIGNKLGWWYVLGSISWGGTITAAMRYGTRVALNGTTIDGTESFFHCSNANAMSSFTFGLALATLSTDYVEIHGRQDTGLAQVTSVSGAYRPYADLRYLGPS